MISLGTPDDLHHTPVLKKYVCVVAFSGGTGYLENSVSFFHSQCMATDEDAAYDSLCMEAMEQQLIARGATLLNKLVVEVAL